MKFALFYHSLCSDWNHGNAHFLRGFATELLTLGHEVQIYEPRSGWSRARLIDEQGADAVNDYQRHYPQLQSHVYEPETLDLGEVLEGVDVLIAHEWNEASLIARLGAQAERSGCLALFHDTHHRSVTEPGAMAALDLRHYAGVLAYGASVAMQYRRYGWARRVWVWHEGADVRRFRPLERAASGRDLVWIGNWGDEERSAELREFLIEPVRALGLNASVHGVGYPPEALEQLCCAGIDFRGWLPNYEVPAVFAEYECTVHVPRQAYVHALPGVPTIRMFEALACGIPLVSAPWDDAEHLFRTGTDYLTARNGEEMCDLLGALLADTAAAHRMAQAGMQTILQHHTCRHRALELLDIVTSLRPARSQPQRIAAGAAT